ncbi:MAG: hypothetical protein GVY28_09200 [Alphaproteobacteria bacterium]|jgi:hypothetical protein|nr:hypothetical protein [Alphaproteobacteria bacterium]
MGRRDENSNWILEQYEAAKKEMDNLPEPLKEYMEESDRMAKSLGKEYNDE